MNAMKKLFTFILFAVFSLTVNSQSLPLNYFEKEGEVYFRFKLTDKAQIYQLTKIISIDNVINDSVYCYANEKEYYNFLRLKIEFQILPHPGDVKDVRMSSNLKEINAWDVYPTYDAYVQMMYQFQTQFPNICKIVDAGLTAQGRKILFAVISDSINANENEPKFMYSSSMHGDETTGYVLMLRLIDSLLNAYGTDQRITNLVNKVEIWINPLANPDGTYRSGNNTVSGARRGNYNNIDLNRNFPDPQDGQHPDGNSWQPETIIMMNLANQNNFVLSANFHGGTEVVNYPWDTWSRLHADDNWFQFISHLYADTVQGNSPSTYMRGYNDGITNGYAWYRVAGGRQDYFTYFKRGREVTIELSNTKLLSASLLPAHWNYNRKSFIQYIENCLFGLTGKVTDIYGNPIKAKIKIESYDKDNSDVFSDSLTGRYLRMLSAGYYTFTFSADSFYTQTFSNVPIINFYSKILNVQLERINPIPVELTSFSASIQNEKVLLNWQTSSEKNNKGFEIQKGKEAIQNSEINWEVLDFINGCGTTTEKQNYFFTDKNIEAGSYSYRLKQLDFDGSFNFSNIIKVEVDLAPQKFLLEQNYPNPFSTSRFSAMNGSSTTKIQFTIPASLISEKLVTLKVFDILGKEITTLVNEVKEAGAYTVELSNSKLNLSAGVYFYELKTGTNRSIKKFVITK